MNGVVNIAREVKMDYPTWKNTCCNPFAKPRHSKRSKLRPVLPWMCEKKSTLTLDDKICDDCRKKLATMPSIESSQEDGEVDAESDVFEKEVSLESLNTCLRAMGETPVVKEKLQLRKYPKEKMKKITTAMKKKISVSEASDSESEMIKQLKEKFNYSTERSEKVEVLTVLPKSWPVRRVQDEFGASNYMVRTAKQLVKQKGILSTPNLKQGHALSAEVVSMVAEFYDSDEVSRVMPGKKEFVSVRVGANRIHVQKRLVLSNLKETYRLFKEKFPAKTLGFSKFAELRPKHCILAGASGTHSVCVCTIHQNVKLMMIGGNIFSLTAMEDPPLQTYDHCLAQIICNPPLPDCYLNRCPYCPGIATLKEKLKKLMDENLVDNIIYKQWVSTDRSTLETFSDSLQMILLNLFVRSWKLSFPIHSLRNNSHTSKLN